MTARAAVTALAFGAAALAAIVSHAHHGSPIAESLAPLFPSEPSETTTPQPAPGGGTQALTRADYDRSDAVDGNQTHLVYFVPRDRGDSHLDTDGTIVRSAASILDWFSHWMGRRPRLDRLSTGTPDVSFVAGARVAASYRAMGTESYLDAIAAELQAKGFDDRSKRYLVYAEIPSARTCGEGFWPGHVAAVYLEASPSCGARDFAGGASWESAGRVEAVAAQEWIHNEGIVAAAAPHACPVALGHVCTGPLALTTIDPEQADVMFPYINRPLSAKLLDPGRDDYFGHSLPTPDLRDSPWLE